MPDKLSLLVRPLAENPVSPAFADWDGDGALDIIVGLAGRVYLFARTATGVAAPAELKVEQTPLANVIVSAAPRCGHLAPCPADLDADGDLDLLLGDDEGAVWWVPNEGSSDRPILGPPAHLGLGGLPAQFGARARVAVGDWNADGYPDVFVGNAAGTIHLSTGSPRGPGKPKPFLGAGASAAFPDTDTPRDLCPTVSRWYGDSEGDRLLVGDRRGFIWAVKPGPEGKPVVEGCLQAAKAPIDAGRCASVRAVDWDGDRQTDLVVGGEDGYVQLFRRVKLDPPEFATGRRVVARSGPVRAAPRAGAEPHLRYAWPCLADIDADGDPDLLLGQANGRVRLWLNDRGFKAHGDLQVAGDVLTLAGMSTVHAVDYDRDEDVDVFVGARLLPGSTVHGQLCPETALYLENVAGRMGRVPLFVKAVRMDAYLVPKGGGSARDADIMSISAMQPVYWNRDGILDFLLLTRLGAYVFRSGASRNSYPRLELPSSVPGIPAPLLPPSWSVMATRFTNGRPGLLAGMEETGWVVWYPRKELPAADRLTPPES